MKNIKYLIIVLLLTPMHAKVGWEQIYYAGRNEIFERIVSTDSLDCIALIDRMGFCKIIGSTDGGCSWDTLHDETAWDVKDWPSPQWVFDIQFPAKGYLYVSYDSGVIRRSYDRGKTFKKIELPVNFWIKFLHMKDSITGIAATHQEVFITEDGWDTWEEIDVDWKKYIKDVYMHSIDTFAIVSSQGVIGPVYYRTTDRGKSWSEQYLGGGEFQAYRVFFLDGKIGWIAGGQEVPNAGDALTDVVYKTTDKGAHWELIYNQYNDHPFGLQDIAFKDEYNGIAVGQSSKILRTSDGGYSWVQDTMIRSQGVVESIPTMTVHYLGSKPLIGTFVSGIYTMPEFVGIEEQPKHPEELLLFPNPAKNVLNIKLPETLSPTELRIYNILGEKVLTAETQIPEAKLNISNLPSGVYTIRATINGTEHSEKFVKGE